LSIVNYFFGTAVEQVYPQKHTHDHIRAQVRKDLSLPFVALPRQVHGDRVWVVRDVTHVSPQADAVITDQKGCGIGVLTADCLPIILYDTKKNVGGVVHAGWRGTRSGIVQKTIAALQHTFGTQVKDIRVTLGPAAGPCCYEVSAVFKNEQDTDVWRHALTLRNDTWFFDNNAVNCAQLYEVGIVPGHIDCAYNTCTICDMRYCSYRRAGKTAGRQYSVLVL